MGNEDENNFRVERLLEALIKFIIKHIEWFLSFYNYIIKPFLANAPKRFLASIPSTTFTIDHNSHLNQPRPIFVPRRRRKNLMTTTVASSFRRVSIIKRHTMRLNYRSHSSRFDYAGRPAFQVCPASCHKSFACRFVSMALNFSSISCWTILATRCCAWIPALISK